MKMSSFQAFARSALATVVFSSFLLPHLGYAAGGTSTPEYQRIRKDHFCDFFNTPTDNNGQSPCAENKPGKIPGGDIDPTLSIFKNTINLEDPKQHEAVMGLLRNFIAAKPKIKLPENTLNSPEAREWILLSRQVQSARKVVEKFFTAGMIAPRQAIPPSPAEQAAMAAPAPNPVIPPSILVKTPPGGTPPAPLPTEPPPAEEVPPTEDTSEPITNGFLPNAFISAAIAADMRTYGPPKFKLPIEVRPGCGIEDLPGFDKMDPRGIPSFLGAVGQAETDSTFILRSYGGSNYAGFAQTGEANLVDLGCVVHDCCTGNNNFGGDPAKGSKECLDLIKAAKGAAKACPGDLKAAAWAARKEAYGGNFKSKQYDSALLVSNEHWISPCTKGSAWLKQFTGINNSEDYLYCPRMQLAVLTYSRMGPKAPEPYAGKVAPSYYFSTATGPKESCFMVDGHGPVTLSGLRSISQLEGNGGVRNFMLANLVLDPNSNGRFKNYISRYTNHQRANDGTCHFIKEGNIGKKDAPCVRVIVSDDGTFTLPKGVVVNPEWDTEKRPATWRRNNRDMDRTAWWRAIAHSGYLTDPEDEPDPSCGGAIPERAKATITIDGKTYKKNDALPPHEGQHNVAARDPNGAMNAPVNPAEPLGPMKPTAEIIHEIQRKAGVPESEIADDPSYYEILLTLAKIRFQDPNYYVDVMASDAAIDKALAEIKALQVIIARESRGQVEFGSLLKATETSLDYSLMPPAVKGIAK